MTRFNITVPKTYQKDGMEKTAWNNVGTLVHFPAREGKGEFYILELHIFPNTKFSVFEATPRKPESQESGYKEPEVQVGRFTSPGVDGEPPINMDEVPF